MGRSAIMGSMTTDDPLSAGQRAFLLATRRAVLVTIARDGRPRPVPICFVLSDDAPILYTPIDDKPKGADDPRALARVRDIARDDRVSILADRWDEEWSHLAWLRIEGRARLLDPGDAATADERQVAVGGLRAKYEQYAVHRLEARPLIRIDLERTVEWGQTAPDSVYGG
jgi:PPOX class probable F420-dependent enzyme